MRQVIGLTGLKGSGKTTGVAHWLVAKHGFTILGFADEIKAMGRVLGLSDAQLEGADKDKPAIELLGRIPRSLLQYLGLYDPDLWSYRWRQRFNQLSQNRNVVAPDVRFGSNFSSIREFGGVIWRINRPGIKPDTHPSETAGVAFLADVTLENDGTLDDLRMKIDMLLRQPLTP